MKEGEHGFGEISNISAMYTLSPNHETYPLLLQVNLSCSLLYLGNVKLVLSLKPGYYFLWLAHPI